MVQQQPDEFLAGVTGCADDGDFLRLHISNLTGRVAVSATQIFFQGRRHAVPPKTKKPRRLLPAGPGNFQRD
jgi:hypothetical protein